MRTVNRRAFTLVEMTLVITILVLFAAVIMPNLEKQKESRDIRQFYAGVRNLMVGARENAVTDGKARTIRYDDSSKSMTVETQDDQTGSTQQEKTLALPEAVTADAFRVDKVDGTSSDWAMGFYPDGRSEGGAIQFSADGASQTILIGSNGSVTSQKGAMPDITEDEWDAGGYEQRV